MTAKKSVVRRAAGAALALVLALVVVGSVAAATRGDRTPPTTPTNLRVTSVSHTSVTLAAIEYEIYVNGVLSPLAVGAGIDRDFVYGTARGEKRSP